MNLFVKNILIAALILMPAIVFGQECEKFKTGTFIAKDESGKEIPDYKIVRTKKKQVEYLPNGEKIIMTVNWTSECTYELTFVKGEYHIPKGTVTRVRITRTFGTGYEGEGTSDLSTTPVPFKMYLKE